MISSLQRLAKRLAQKLAVSLLIVVLVLAAGGLWIFWRDRVIFSAAKPQFLAGLKNDRQQTAAALDDVSQRRAEMQSELAQQQAREHMTDRAIAGLRQLHSWWDSWFGDREKQRAYADQLARDEQLKHDTEAREVGLVQELRRTRWEKDGLEIELSQLDRRIHAAETNQSRFVTYLVLTWDKVKGYAVAALGLYFFGPALCKRLCRRTPRANSSRKTRIDG
jgi:DNA repair exonuclease SbcCD ATPase subunit